MLEQFLGGERHKDRGTGGSESPLNLNLIESQRQRGNKSLLLLVVERANLAMILLRHTGHLKDIVYKFGL